MLDPSVGKSIDNTLGSYVNHWSCHRPSRKPVHCSEEVFIPVGQRKRHDIDVGMLETARGYLEVANWRLNVFCYLCLLTGKTLSRPLGNVLAD